MRIAWAARTIRGATVVVCLASAAASLHAQTAPSTLPSDVAGKIDAAVEDVLTKSGAPSASVAIVRDGALAYVKAYGKARVGPPVLPAATGMRYSIGSISKQFTAAAVLLLVEDGTLSLDDKVGRWFPELTRAGDVSIRQLLSMTSGYQDFWPQDYVMPGMLKNVTPAEILRGWAQKPLDFEPGTRWQYSNTNYVIAGQIVERVSGKPLLPLLRERMFDRLLMTSVVDTDQAALGPGDPMRYLRYALGPPREAPKEGRGWMSAAGELAMTARDLALWDISLIDRSVLRPSSYRDLETEVLLSNGSPTGYGLGVNVAVSGGRRQISHGGEVSGFTARNEVYPEERVAIAVLVNLDATAASTQIAGRIASTLFATATPGTSDAVDQARRIFTGLQRGQIDRSLLTANASAYFNEQALKDFQSSLGPLGTPTSFTQAGQSLRGGMVFRRFQVATKERNVSISTFMMPDGKFEQFLVSPTD